MTSIQDKLKLVFPEFFQVKRVKKEIDQILQAKSKYSYEPKMSFSRGQSVTFLIEFVKGAFKNYKRLQLEKNFQIKIILKKQYPVIPPLIYCMSDSMINYGLEPFRDYSEFLTVDWSAKFTVMDIIKVFLDFVDKWNVQNSQRKGKYRTNQSFQIQRVFSWSFLQTFPVKFVHPNRSTLGLLIISCQIQIILLEQYEGRQAYLTKDLIRISDLISIFKGRKSNSQILLEVKKQQSKYCLAFRSDDSQNIINYIIDYMKIANSFGSENTANEESSESDNDETNIEEKQELSKQSPTKANIEEIKEEIVLFESLVQNKMTCDNVSNLVVLLKKAIEYYSAIGSSDFEIYLKKLKTLMSNQMAQALLQSTKDSEMVANSQNIQDQNNKAAFQSIVDLI